MWLCSTDSNPREGSGSGTPRLGEGCPPRWVEVRLPRVSPGCGTPRPHGTWLPVPSLRVGLGKVEGSFSATLAMPTTGGRTGENPCQFTACRRAHGQRSSAGRRKYAFFLAQALSEREGVLV